MPVKKRCISLLIFLVLLVGVLSACTMAELPMHNVAITALSPAPTYEPRPEPSGELTPVNRRLVETILHFRVSNSLMKSRINIALSSIKT